jgi:hypothetical protein
VKIEDEIARRGIRLKRVGAELVGPCPKCGGDDRFAINVAKQVFNCRGCGARGDVINLVEHLENVDFIAACTELTGKRPPKQNGKDCGDEAKAIVVADFAYQNEDGSVAFAVERVEYQNADGSFVAKGGKRKKIFRQKRPDPDRPGAWLWNVDGVPSLPYRLPELLEAIAGERPIVIVEGEKCADALWAIGIPATTNAAGAGKWKIELCKYFAGSDVILVPDNDDAGRKHVQDVRAKLTGVAKRIRVVVLPNLLPKGDVADWLAHGATREQLDVLIERAPDRWPLVTKADTADNDEADTDGEGGLLLLPPPSQPMAVARVFVRECLHDNMLTLRCWRGGWWMWKTTHWVEVEDSAVRSVLYRFTENASIGTVRHLGHGHPIDTRLATWSKRSQGFVCCRMTWINLVG